MIGGEQIELWGRAPVEIVGFTGTRHGMTTVQLLRARELLIELSPRLVVHGACLGADDEFDQIAVAAGTRRWIMPSLIQTRSVPTWTLLSRGSDARIDPPEKPLVRNRSIVNGCDLLVACPAEIDDKLRSGTWSTIRYARSMRRKTILIQPDGKAFEYGYLRGHHRQL